MYAVKVKSKDTLLTLLRDSRVNRLNPEDLGRLDDVGLEYYKNISKERWKSYLKV